MSAVPLTLFTQCIGVILHALEVIAEPLQGPVHVLAYNKVFVCNHQHISPNHFRYSLNTFTISQNLFILVNNT